LTTASVCAAPNADVPFAASAISIKLAGACYPEMMEQMTGAETKRGGRSRPFLRSLDVSYMPFGLNTTTAF
jgi:hypothetical protein